MSPTFISGGYCFDYLMYFVEENIDAVNIQWKNNNND